MPFTSLRENVFEGDCLEILTAFPDASVDAVFTDPPYPEIDRPYGRLSSAQWQDLMHALLPQLRRILRPDGSALLVLQPNSERVGCMRTWLWEFLAWVGGEWNIVQDAYWWNYAAAPTVHAQRRRGLMRPSLKYCVWLGAPACYRNQDAVLWQESEASVPNRLRDRALRYMPSSHHRRQGRTADAAQERGGTTPFNVLPVLHNDGHAGGDALAHGATTPLALARWWVRYITPPGGMVLDPFAGSGTTAIAAMQEGRHSICIEKEHQYVVHARERIAAAQPALPLAI